MNEDQTFTFIDLFGDMMKQVLQDAFNAGLMRGRAEMDGVVYKYGDEITVPDFTTYWNTLQTKLKELENDDDDDNT